MAISTGERLPEASLMRVGENGPETVPLAPMLAGRRVVVFGVPGAYTGTCTTAHVPSFIRTRDDLMARGVDEIVCVAVNDPFVMKAWGESTGAAAAGITMLADPASDFTRAIGLAFSAPAVGFADRSRRYAMLVEDGVVRVLHVEESPGTCDVSGGESMLAAL